MLPQKINNQPPALTSLPEPLRQQRDYHLSLAVKTDNPKEVTKLIDATYGRKLGTVNMHQKEDQDKVIDLVSYWRTLLGAIKDVHPAQLKVEAAYLVENYPTLTFSDINLAMDCLIQQKLDLRLPFVINFSALFMGQVLDAYRRYKAEEINKISEQVTPPVPPSQKLTPSQKAEEMKSILRLCRDQVVDGCKERFFNGIVYDFLRRTGRLVLNDQVIEDGKKYCAKKMMEYQAGTIASLNDIVNKRKSDQDAKRDREAQMRQHKIDYCLIYFFSTQEIDKIIEGICSKDYQ
jgi:hypothetical protein